MKTVLSGIRATGRLHLGNFLGVLQRFANMSEDPTLKCFFFVADLHTLTTLKEAEKIRESLPEVILDYLAAGINPEKSIIYVQSAVLETCELSWFLSCLTPVGDLLRMPTYKEKKEKQPKDINAGLLTYPVLMAADILGPRANIVPVGKDQRAHLEMAQELAKKFNRIYKTDFFPVPDMLRGEMIMVPGLELMSEDGTFPKMGKSDDNTINLSDSPFEIWDKIKVSPTDPARKRKTDPGNPQKCAIYALHTFVSSDEELQNCIKGCKNATMGCIDCKKILHVNICKLLNPFWERRKQFKKEQVFEILRTGAMEARPVIAETVEFVRQKMGIQKF